MAIVDIGYEKWQKDFEDEFPDLFKGGSLTGPVTALRRDLMRTAYMAGKKASRQPVGHESVCRIIQNAAGQVGIEFSGGKTMMDHVGTTLYAGPPAQGIDLGPLAEALRKADSLIKKSNKLNADSVMGLILAPHVRALLDGRDAGTGVGS